MAYRKEYEVLYQTVQAFLKRCVVNNYSLLWPNSQYWTVKNLQDIKGRMIDNAIMGDSKSFEDKLKEQMAGATPELWGIICDIYFVYFLPSSSMKYKKKRGDILKACEYGKLTPPPENSEIWKALKSGFTRTSMRYHTKYGQFWLLILFALSIKNYSDSATEVDDSKRVQQIFDSCLQGIEAKNDRAWDMRHALLYMAYPNNYERMISSRDKNRVFERYRDLIDESKTTDLDERVLAIRKALSEKYDKGDVLFDFYEDLKSEWRPTKQKIRDDSKKDELSARSWSRPDGMDNLIGIKQIDLSVFRYGTHIPMQFHQFFSEANKGVQIKRGHSEDVTLLIGDNKYDARLTNIKRTNISSDTLQLRYDNNDKMKELVKNIFSLTYRITHKKDIISKSAKPDLIENSFEFMEFYKTDLPFEYRVKFKKSELTELELKELFTDSDSIDPVNPIFSLDEISDITGIGEGEIQRWVNAIERKSQAVIYGPPGTGKTFIADHLAKYLIGGGDGFYELVQFHPTYSYEDFIQGLRPQINENGQLEYVLVQGRFLDFCGKAENCLDTCVLIIDEINRANLSRVFGELMYLLEYRDQSIPIASGGELRIPENKKIIGTMNTADRSIALVDHALRRRFAFLSLRPNYKILKLYHEGTGFKVGGLVEILKKLNLQIADPNYEIGITFFLLEDIFDQIEDVWKMEIEPYLEEYFFDQPEKVNEFRWQAINNKIL